MKKVSLLRAFAFAAVLPFASVAHGEIIVLVCTFASTNPAEADVRLEKAVNIDFERQTVDGERARISAQEIAWDTPGPDPGEVLTTKISRFGGQMSVRSSTAGEVFVGRCGKVAQTGF
jgi:hypothetical protein